jgi:hypothetical protein
LIKQYPDQDLGFNVKEAPDVWVCDCLPHEYLVIEDGKFIPTKL